MPRIVDILPRHRGGSSGMPWLDADESAETSKPPRSTSTQYRSASSYGIGWVECRRGQNIADTSSPRIAATMKVSAAYLDGRAGAVAGRPRHAAMLCLRKRDDEAVIRANAGNVMISTMMTLISRHGHYDISDDSTRYATPAPFQDLIFRPRRSCHFMPPRRRPVCGFAR